MNRTLRRISSFILVAVCSLGLLAGCQSGRLEQGGAYAPLQTNTVAGVETITPASAPDAGLFAVDTTFDLLYTTVQGVFKLERDNRAFFKTVSPTIKSSLDSIRPQAKMAVEEFARAREGYLANPTQAGLSVLDEVLSRMRSLSAAAQALLPDAAAISRAQAEIKK